MRRILALALNRFSPVPHSLREDPSKGIPATVVECDLARLFHHYYNDMYGRNPPKPDPAQFEYLQFITQSREFRFVDDGLGASIAARRNASTALGQAFCRWFLYEHANITYFAHMDRVLGKQLHPGFGQLRIVRTKSGDVPDYVCAKNTNTVRLAEAKGRYSSVSFGSREFGSWRDQFTRVEVRNAQGTPCAVKGFIVATRFATEANRTSLKTGVFAEDPDTLGDGPLDEDSSSMLFSRVRDEHYVSILQKLDQTIIASALSSGVTIPDELTFQATVWQLQVSPATYRRYVGGYWPSESGFPPFTTVDGKLVSRMGDPLRLDQGRGTFYGVEESVFRGLVLLARTRRSDVPMLDDVAPFYSAVSQLRDGSIIGPVELFSPIDVITV